MADRLRLSFSEPLLLQSPFQDCAIVYAESINPTVVVFHKASDCVHIDHAAFLYLRRADGVGRTASYRKLGRGAPSVRRLLDPHQT